MQLEVIEANHPIFSLNPKWSPSEELELHVSSGWVLGEANTGLETHSTRGAANL